MYEATRYDITALRTYQEEIQRAEREAQARAKELALLMDTVPAFTFIAHDPDMIGRTLTLVEDVLKTQRITVHVEATDDPEIYGHMGECCQVLLNLLMNARDAFSEREREEPRLVEIKAFPEGETTVITVWDNAGGIPEEIMARIFDPYFTTKDPEQGTGLGLFMARTIVEGQMDGRFSVRNVGGGAKFRLEVSSRAH